MFALNGIIHTARIIRSHLAKIMEAEDAFNLGEFIDTCIELAEYSDDADALLLKRFMQEERLNSWVRTLLSDNIHIPIKSITDKETLFIIEFVCPVKGCDFIWSVTHTGQAVPLCLIHNKALILESQLANFISQNVR